MPEKVKTAIFGKDLRIELKNYPLSKSGNKIDIVDTGDGYFMPEIGPTTFLDWPSFKRYFLFGPRTYKRVFFALKKGAKCVDFGKDEGIVYGPDQEQLKKANANLLATKIGQDNVKGTPWYVWFLIIMLTLNFILQLRISGVIT
ncbi:MAG TPA: hypothetical protein VMW32_06970 [Bacteroidales bacterium]|nr:hypothetical protein [Bacteroidales bacterium]